MRQLSFFKAPKLVYGGSIAPKKRKGARPLSTKRPLHLVLKSRKPILYRNRKMLLEEVGRKAAHFGLTRYSAAVEQNHIHLILRVPGRTAYRAFVRALTGVLARKLGKGLWRFLPFSRVMAWGKDFRQGLEYLKQNREEAAGIRPYTPRKDWYGRWRIHL